MPFKLVKARRSAKIVAVLLVTSTSFVCAVEIGARLEAQAMLKRALVAHQGLHVDAIVAEPFAGHVSLRGVTLRSGKMLVSIGALRLPLARSGFGFMSAAYASPFDDKETPSLAPAPVEPPAVPRVAVNPPAIAPMGSTSADNVVIISGATTYRVKRIEMTGTSLSNADLAALLDSGGNETAEARLKKFSAAAVVIPELLADKKDAATEQHMSMTHILLANVVDGKVAAASAGEISFSVKDKAVTNGTTGSLEATDLNLTQIAHVFGSVRTDEAEPIKPLYDAFVVNSIKVTNVSQNSTFAIAKLKEVGAKGRALKTDIASASSAAAKADPSDAKSAALFDDMAHSFQFGLLEMTDVSSKSDTPDGTTTFAIASASIDHFADRKIGGLALAGFHLEGPGMVFGLGTLTVGAFTIPPATGSTAPPSTMTPPASIAMDKINVDVVSKNDKTDDRPATTMHVKFQVNHAAFASEGQLNEIPLKSALDIDDVSFDVPPGDPAGFNAMGYKHVVLSGSLSTTYVAAAQDLQIGNLAMNGVDMGAITASARLVNVGKGLLSSDKDIQSSSIVAMLLRNLDIKVKNAGLSQKALAYKAGNDGMTVAQEREAEIDFFTEKMPTIANNNAKARLVGAAIAKFIADPRTLHIAIASKSGIGAAAIGLLGSPDLILDTLDVQASAND